ncbi:Fungal specific transcription factor domain-containing protein [Cladophialophora immunda]|nr:Fungal specific transcription factor domain-containing protein [Cladophialophora immunda]
MPEPNVTVEQADESILWNSLSDQFDTSPQRDQPFDEVPQVVLPHYLRPVPKHISNEDLAYLQKKGAFDIPATIQRNELLRCYIQYVHPLLPIIDLRDFLRSIDRNDANDTISLMLLQAVMFAGTTFIDMNYVTGYEDRRAYQKAYFQKVKMLYDLDYEEDRVTIVQCVLLMTYWYESPNHPKDIWHWVGIAVADARSVGLNCVPQENSGTLQEKRLWKRIWWGCYMRDRLVASGMRRTMRIKEEECCVQGFDIEDFEACTSLSDFEHMIGSACAVGSGTTHTNLVRLCVALVDLCKIIADILTLQYATPSQKIGGTHEATMKLLPKSPSTATEVGRRDRDLETWYEGLPVEIRYSFPETQDDRKPISDRLVYLHSAVVASVYTAITSTLHRPQCMIASTKHMTESQKTSKMKVYDAASKVASLFRDIVARNMTESVPNTSVAVLLPACVVLHADARSTTSSTCQESRERLQDCVKVLQRLRDTFNSADFALLVLSQAVQKLNLAPQVPTTQLATPPASNTSQHRLHPTSPQDHGRTNSLESPQEKVPMPGLGPAHPQTGSVTVEMSTDNSHLMELDELAEEDGHTETQLDEMCTHQQMDRVGDIWWDDLMNY